MNIKKNNSNLNIREWPALSVVKFICVAVMIFVHAHLIQITTKSYSIPDINGFFYKTTSELMFIGLFVFILPIIAGAVFRVDLDSYINDGRLVGYSFKKVVNIAVFLFLVGFLMNVLVAGLRYTFSWNVLQLIAFSLLVIVALLKFFSVRVILPIGAVSLLVAKPLRDSVGNLDHSYFVSILFGGGDGFIFWPFFPWFSVVAFGFLFAHFYLKYNDNVKFRISALSLGILFLAVAIFSGEISPYLDPVYVWGASLFQPKIGFVLAAMGLFCVLTIVLNCFFNNIKLSRYGIVNSYSKAVIWIYVFQMIANYKLSIIIRNYFPMNEPTMAYFILPTVTLLLSWAVGALAIKLLQEKLIVIKLKKIDEK